MHTRHYIRHPVNIPIETDALERSEVAGHMLAYSIGRGGLAFHSREELEPGRRVRLRIRHVSPEFESDALVVWCRPAEGCVEVGVEFLNSDDAFRARMVEQVCHIESYRQDVLASEGRILSPEDAASEWIGKYAAGFPAAGSGWSA